MTEQVVKSKDLRIQIKEWMAVFFTKCVKNIVEKAVSIIDESFEHNGIGISYQKKVGKP